MSNERTEEAFYEMSFLTKEDVIADLEYEIDLIAEKQRNAIGEQARYWQTKRSFLAEFIEEIKRVRLFDKLEPMWCYQYTISSRGAFLELVHVEKVAVHKDGTLFHIPDSELLVVNKRAKTMSIEEYSKFSGKNPVALRQALRRGKYRSAYKVGQEWRIPELCEPDAKRGYKPGMYEWEDRLNDLPEGFEYLSDLGGAIIGKEPEDVRLYTLFAGHGEKKVFKREIPQKDIERLEHYLVANPMVTVKDDEVRYFNKRVRKHYEANRSKNV